MSEVNPQSKSPPKSDAQKVKLSVLAKALKEERKKTEDLEKELKQSTEELVQLREEVVTKQERIDKLKEEISKYRNSGTKNIQTFVKGFFEEDKSQTQSEVDDEKVKLKMENEDFKKDIENLKTEKEDLNKKLEETQKEKKQKEEELNKEIEKLKKENETQIKKLKEDYETKIGELQREIFNKNQKIGEQSNCLGHMSELCKTFDIQKFDYEKEINELKEENKNLSKIASTSKEAMTTLSKNQDILSLQMMEDKDNIKCLKEEINQYKKIIEELTPINKDYLFKGEVLVYDNERIEGRIEASFEKEENNLWIKLSIKEIEEEIIILGKDIYEAYTDSIRDYRVWFTFSGIFNSKGGKKKILIEFTKKETKSFIQFCKETKKKNDHSIFNTNYDKYFY